jgi:hypothetical protein
VERRRSFSTTVRQSGLTLANESSVCIRRKREQEEEGECLHRNDRILHRNSRCDAAGAISHAGRRPEYMRMAIEATRFSRDPR